MASSLNKNDQDSLQDSHGKEDMLNHREKVEQAKHFLKKAIFGPPTKFKSKKGIIFNGITEKI